MFGKKKVTIQVRDLDGIWKEVPIQAGKSAMEAITKANLRMEASCGGECACSTCHVFVESAWLNRLPLPTDEEETMIEYASRPSSNSRLACQIILNEEHESMRLEIAGG